jgi:ketosteroid isomerase-like protein
MSGSNVEVLARGFEAVNRRDVEGLLDGIDPAIEWYPTPDFIDFGPFRGHAGVRRLLTTMLDAFDSFTLEPEELIDCGERIVAPVHQIGQGKGSHAAVEVRYIMVFTMRDGKAVRVDSFYDRDEALAFARSGPPAES